jgi:hypothetical protein
MIGAVVPSLTATGIFGSVLTLADLPLVSGIMFMLAWQHPWLSTIWMGFAGTLWWYLLSLLAEALFRKKRVLAT